LSRREQTFLERAPQAFERNRVQDRCEERIAELERMVGRLTMEAGDRKKLTATGLTTGGKRGLAKMLSDEEHYPVRSVTC
jgi:hypothetical protein